MVHPNKRQWGVIWIVAAAVLLLWPTADSPSLAVKAVHFAADPRGTLPVLPEPLPLGLGDDADVVMQHDYQTQAYYDAYDSSAWVRFRMKVRDWSPGVGVATERQILMVFIVLGALLVWRLGAPGASTEKADAGG